MGQMKAGDEADTVDVTRPARGLDDLRIVSPAGGLVILGPSAARPKGLDALLSSPEATPVQASTSRLSTWKAASAEVLAITRQTSSAVRDGKAAIVYLDSHRDAEISTQADRREFVCARLGQVLVGLADAPAYVVIHGQTMAQSLIYGSLGGTDLPMLGAIADQLPVWELNDRMFSGTAIAVCPGSRAVTAVAQALDWFEARRSEPTDEPSRS